MPSESFSPGATQCRPCRNERNRRRYPADREALRLVGTSTCNTCGKTKPADDFVASKRTRCKTCHKLAQKGRYHAGDKALANAKAKAWANANREKRRESAAAYNRRRRVLDPTWARSHDQRNNTARHARISGAERCLITDRDLARLRDRQRGCCAYCDALAPLTVEHVVPLVRGGRHSIGNIVLACGRCNSSKGRRLLVEWRAWQAQSVGGR
jgi:5-methylcytosine-specific restriction endonuclease McrA